MERKYQAQISALKTRWEEDAKSKAQAVIAFKVALADEEDDGRAKRDKENTLMMEKGRK